MLHKDVLKKFRFLPAKVQKYISTFIEKFQADISDPTLHVHSVKESMLDPKVHGADLPEAFRAIIIAPDKGDTWLLMHIDKHDDAYAWAKNKRFEVHEKTGIFQVFDAEMITEQQSEKTSHISTQADYPLLKMSDEELFSAGVPRQLIPAVQAVDSDESFEALAVYLPQDCREVLCGIAAGMTLDESLEATLGSTRSELSKTLPESSGDFSFIGNSPVFDLVPVKGEEHLNEILSASLEEWRLFLHPSQRKIVTWNVNGPMCISGSAGTGKTVAILHRAVNLVKVMEQNSKQGRVLLTTFTTTLAPTIKDLLKRLDPGRAEKIEVTNLHSLAHSICIRTGWKGAIASDFDIADAWEKVKEDKSLGDVPVEWQELEIEYNLIIGPNGIDNEDAYLTTIRSGRPRYNRAKRRQVWPFIQSFLSQLDKRNQLTFHGMIHQARLAIENKGFEPYEHVLVDEIQDFGLEALRLIRLLSPVGTDSKNPLCVAGDGHQRIYGVKIPLSRAGIEVRGRSRRLKINYRTTDEIRKYAHGILCGINVDDLDDGDAVTLGDRSVLNGPVPIIEHCDSEEHEIKTIVGWVNAVIKEKNIPSSAICIAGDMRGKFLEQLEKEFINNDIAVYKLKPNVPEPGESEPGVRIGTMYRVKGLEYRAVVLACANATDPMNTVSDQDIRARCLRYVAVTRAREIVIITLAK